jgi:RNA polymerase sigma-70 factor (ECF subfamily)
MTTDLTPPPFDALRDEEIVDRVVAGEACLFAVLMRRYNQRLFRVVRGIVDSPCEAEDVVQQAYLAAYAKLAQFAGRSTFSTWLTRIAIHEALTRLKSRARSEVPLDDGVAASYGGDGDPEHLASTRELARLFEEACDSLPDIYRVVFMMRGIEEMSTAETAACLDLSEEAVKVRFHRARSILRARIDDRVGGTARDAFSFLGAKCAGMVATVGSRLGWSVNSSRAE